MFTAILQQDPVDDEVEEAERVTEETVTPKRPLHPPGRFSRPGGGVNREAGLPPGTRAALPLEFEHLRWPCVQGVTEGRQQAGVDRLDPPAGARPAIDGAFVF